MNAVDTKPKDIVRSTVGDAVRVALILHGAEQTAQLIADALDAEDHAVLDDALGRLRDPLDEPDDERMCKRCRAVKPIHSDDMCPECVAEAADWYERVMSIKKQPADEPDDEPLATGEEVEIVGPNFCGSLWLIGRRGAIFGEPEEDGDWRVSIPGEKSYEHCPPSSLRRVPAESEKPDGPDDEPSVPKTSVGRQVIPSVGLLRGLTCDVVSTRLGQAQVQFGGVKMWLDESALSDLPDEPQSEKDEQSSEEPDDEPLEVDDPVEIVGPVSDYSEHRSDPDQFSGCVGIVRILPNDEFSTFMLTISGVAACFPRSSLRRVPAEGDETVPAGDADGPYYVRDGQIHDARADLKRRTYVGLQPVASAMNRQYVEIERLTRERDEARAERDERPTRDELTQVTRAADRMSDEIDGLRDDVRAAERAYERKERAERDARIVLGAVRLDLEQAHEQRRDAEAQVARLAEVLHGHLELMRSALNDATSEQDLPF